MLNLKKWMEKVGISLDELNQGKVNKSSDTMIAGIPYLKLKCTAVDASKTDNNVSSTKWPTSFHILDTADRTLIKLEAVINPNGDIGSYWYVRNYNTSGQQVDQKGMSMTMDKSGNLTYDISDPNKFRDAIDAQSTLHYKNFDLSGIAVTKADAGWYYAEIPLNLPSGAMPISVASYGSWDASIFYDISISSGGVLEIKSPTSKTLGNHRWARVFYY